ncbi:MAG TPA: cytochrome P450 [Pseudonocardia sp.]|jgi:cytochrome P450
MSFDISTADLAKVDLTDLDLFADGPPHALFARMREETPVHWNKTAHGAEFWSLTRADDIADASKDPATFSSAGGGIFLRPQTLSRLDLLRRFVIFKDPPEHTNHRSIIGTAFLPRTMIMLDELIKDIVTGVLDNVAERGECDLVHDIAAPIATTVIARLMGAPAADVDRMLVWADALEQGITHSTEVADALEQMSAHFRELVGNQVVRGVDSLAKSIAEGEIDGERLSEDDIAAYFCLLLFVGSNPTRTAISSGMLALIENPEQLELLRNEPSRLRNTRSGLAPIAIDEILRWSTPLNCLARTATRDTSIRGVDIKSGDRLILWYASASRDSEIIPDANTFKVNREAANVPHYAFGGGGPHLCQGANLTHRVLSVTFREMLRRLSNIELAGDISRVQSPFINSLLTLPIRFTAIS